ncbi:dihydrofolate reductase [Reinekea sp. G2M2-21]|uniref:dihydrofolate reductase n=1 Tax=Reinekea sp. G2M2-21 TaxID=2788942 RepID=UPI0018A8A6A8|nr:dihydrofolate reductase [Reinekea sp. G2M2-21]
MKISLIAATSENGVIGRGKDVPWKVRGEQLIFKALTMNQWVLLGRRTYETAGPLPGRHLAVLSQDIPEPSESDPLFFTDLDTALAALAERTDHLFVGGGGQLYQQLIEQADTIHLSVIHAQVDGDVPFPDIPASFKKIYEQHFSSNIDYSYQIWEKMVGG